jgi:hypothetical protein
MHQIVHSDPRYLQLLAALCDNGWDVTTQQASDLDWWASQIWTLYSVWSPHGLQAFLTFLTDPQTPDVVWAVAITAHYPDSHSEEGLEDPISLRHWERHLPDVVSRLAALRANAIQ